MSTFAVISDVDNKKLLQRIESIYSAEEIHKVDSRLLLISSEKDVIAKSVYDKIEGDGVEFTCKGDAEIGRFVIFSITSYYGLHYTSMWEWLAGKVK
ncbi:hypothetical protein [Enterobacter hormaechei]|uniref:hypothetical protein n=1 Tax=Enterobacter hormaechei TaxID=158836 RepID=UPI00197E0C09|nr:hypothetical protein [Enterobacter hormaechei]MBN4787721.1 hypothetical protein [Enterobacter hormaechei]